MSGGNTNKPVTNALNPNQAGDMTSKFFGSELRIFMCGITNQMDQIENPPFLQQWPLWLYSTEGDYIGKANNKQEFIDLWNSNNSNRQLGVLDDNIGDFSFNLYLNDSVDLDDMRGFQLNATPYPALAFSFNLHNPTTASLAFEFPAQKTVWIDWGNGIPQEYDDSSVQIGFDYGGSINDKTINVYFENPEDLEGLDLEDNPTLTALDITELINLTTLLADGGTLSVSNVNRTLVTLDQSGILNGTVDLSGQTPAAAPSTTLGNNGVVAKTNLISDGWTVTTD